MNIKMLQLISNTINFKPIIRQTAKKVRIHFLTPREKIDEDGDKYIEVVANAKGDTVTRKVVIRMWGGRTNPWVWVSCTCEWWLYVCEVAMVENGNSDLGFARDRYTPDALESDGSHPVQTNPSMVPCACKHIIAAFKNGASSLRPKEKAKTKGKPKSKRRGRR